MGPPTSVSESPAVAVALLTSAPSRKGLPGHTLDCRLPPGRGVTNPRNRPGGDSLEFRPGRGATPPGQARNSPLGNQAEALGLLHRFGAVADVELAVQAR